MQPRAPTPSKSASTLHAFLVASTLIVSSGAYVATRSTGAIIAQVAPLELVAVGLGASLLLIAYLLRIRLPPPVASQAKDAWWERSLGNALLIWGLLEAPAFVGAITLFATRRVSGFAVLAFLALGGLFAFSPRRLAEV